MTGGTSIRRGVWVQAGAWVVATVLAATVVPSLSAFYVGAAGEMAAFAIMAMGAGLIIQHANLPSIGHGVFFGIAGYSVGIMMIDDVAGTVLALLLALVITAAFATLMGVVTLRTRAAYFMMITLAIGQLLSGLASSLTDLTGGDNGLTGIPPAMIGNIDLVDPTQFYLLCLTVLIVVSLFILLLTASPYGYALHSLRHDDRRARSLGIGPLRVKLIAFVLSGVITGLGGALYTLNVGYIAPASLSANTSGVIFLMVVLGSRFGVLGPILGAVVVEFITLILSTYTTNTQLILGVVGVLAALFVMRSDDATPARRPPAEKAATPEPADV